MVYKFFGPNFSKVTLGGCLSVEMIAKKGGREYVGIKHSRGINMRDRT